MIHLRPGVNETEYHQAVNAALKAHSGKPANKVSGEATLVAFLNAVRPFAEYIPALYCVFDPIRRHVTVTEDEPGPLLQALAYYPGDAGPPPNMPQTRFDDDLATFASSRISQAAEALEELIDRAEARSPFDVYLRQALHQLHQAAALVPAEHQAAVELLQGGKPASQELILSTPRMGAKPVKPE